MAHGAKAALIRIQTKPRCCCMSHHEQVAHRACVRACTRLVYAMLCAEKNPRMSRDWRHPRLVPKLMCPCAHLPIFIFACLPSLRTECEPPRIRHLLDTCRQAFLLLLPPRLQRRLGSSLPIRGSLLPLVAAWLLLRRRRWSRQCIVYCFACLSGSSLRLRFRERGIWLALWLWVGLVGAFGRFI